MSDVTFTSPLLTHLGGFIAGEWVGAADQSTYAVTDPATGEVLAQVAQLGAPDANRAADAAQAALAHVAPLEKRREQLATIATLSMENADELANIITRENGKPLAEARGEVAYAAGFYRRASHDAAQLVPHVLAEHPGGHTWTVHHRPAGVVALITPWNFPLAMLAKKLSAALAAGCTAVVKPAEVTPLTCIAFFRLLERVGLAAGQVNLVSGDAPAIGEAPCAHDAVRIVSFTGSTAVGRLLAAQAAPRLKRLALELGGNAPFVVFADADLDHAVASLIANKFRAAGQTCVCTNRVLVEESVADDFTDRLAARVAKLVVGPGIRPGVDLGPLVDGRAWDKVRGHVEDALSRGARVVSGAAPTERPTDSSGWFFEPVVLRDVPRDALCFREETFGPIIPITTFANDAEALALATDTDAGLAAYVFTRDAARAERMVAGLRFGHVGLNTGAGPTPEAPFGGMRQSGFGREGGVDGLLEFTETQTVPTPDAR